MRAAQFADPPDARQSRPHDERSRAAQERQRHDSTASARALIGQLAQNNCGAQYTRGRSRRRPAGLLRGAARAAARSSTPAATARRPAPIAPSACAPATAFISRFPIRRCRAGSRTTRKPASGCARRRRPRSTPITIRAKRSNRRSRSTAHPTRRCPTHSAIARKSCPAAPAARPGETWAQALRKRRRPRRWKAATSSSPTRMRSAVASPRYAEVSSRGKARRQRRAPPRRRRRQRRPTTDPTRCARSASFGPPFLSRTAAVNPSQASAAPD